MELKLRDRKFIQNNKKELKEFVNGTPPYMQWQQSPQFTPGGVAGDIIKSAYDTSTEQGRINTVKDLYGPKDDRYTGKQLQDAKTKYDEGLEEFKKEQESSSISPNIGSAIAGGIGAVGTIYNNYASSLRSIDDYLRGGYKNGKLPRYANGVYGPDMSKVNKEIEGNTLNSTLSGAAAGASAGAVLGPWGAAIGGVVGGVGGAISGIVSGNKNKQAALDARAMAGSINNYDRNVDLSNYLNEQYLLENGNTKSQGFAHGKPVYNGWGMTNMLPATGQVSSGETLVEPDGSSYVIPGKPDFKDGKRAYVGRETAVLSNHGASQYYQLTGDLDGALEMDKQSRYSKGMKYKCGKMPKFKEGWWSGFVPNALSGIASIGQMIQAGSQTPYRTNTYEPNRLANRALNTLAGLRVNPYNIYPTIWDAYGRATSSIDRSGGLSSGQRAAAKIAAMSQTQGNIANMLTQHQVQNNAYKANLAQQALSAGAHDASNRMTANQFDESYYAKSHAARQQGLQMGLYNLINSVQNYYANDFKRRQFNDTMDLYRSQNQLDWNKYYKSLT